MAKERLKSPRARLFVALALPDQVREGLVEWQRNALTDRALRPLGPEQLHITLAFLGWKPEREIDRIAELALEGDEPAPRIELLPDPVPRPGPSRPRLFAVAGRSEGVEAIQAGVSARLEAEGFYKPEKRPFWVHVTVARARRERRGSRKPARVETPPGPLPEALLEPFDAVRITLYRSMLRPQGAEYLPMAQRELSPRGAGNEVN